MPGISPPTPLCLAYSEPHARPEHRKNRTAHILTDIHTAVAVDDYIGFNVTRKRCKPMNIHYARAAEREDNKALNSDRTACDVPEIERIEPLEHWCKIEIICVVIRKRTEEVRS